MGNQIGKVVGEPPPDLFRVYIKLNDDEYVYPGELLIAESQLSAHNVLVRAINVEEVNKSISADSLSIEEKLGYKDETEDYPLGKYRVVVAEVLDCIEEKKNGMIVLKGNVCTAKPGGYVYPLSNELTQIIFNGKKLDERKSIVIGSVNAGKASVPFTIDPDIFMRHVLVIGNTGSGKSWFRGVVMEKLKEKDVFQANFDPMGEYVEAVKQLGGVNLRIGRDFLLPLWTLKPNQFYDLIYDFVPTEFQRTIAVEAFKRMRERKGSIKDLIEEVDNVADEMNARDDTRENTINRLKVFFDTLEIAGDDDPVDKIAKNINEKQLLNFDFFGLNELQRDYAVASIMAMLYDFRSSRPPLIRKPILVAIDEAHLYVPSGKRTLSRDIIKDVLRYGRHVGVALMLITQLPSSMDEEAVEMPAVKIIFATSYDQLRGIRFALSDLPDDILESIGKMERGKAIITGTRDQIRYSVLVGIASERK
ncbi:MAG: ATP-binding protein, partial [Infirmifilum sp.]